LYELQAQISTELLSEYIGKEIEVLCDGIDYERNCFVGRAYFNAPDIDGKVYFNAGEAMQGETYKVLIEKSDAYDLYGRTEDYEV
jgi:tRNA A37 methylthiotransferase MiaB